MTVITGKDLIALGFPQGPDTQAALAAVNAQALRGDALAAWVRAHKSAERLRLQDNPGYSLNLHAEDAAEEDNIAKVTATMGALMRTPTLRAGAVMPDACPAGPEGAISVGGVAVGENAIHPGMHSADICCSVMVTQFHGAAPLVVLTAVHKATHFGPGGRPNGARFTMSPDLYDAFRANSFLSDKKILQAAREHPGTQGDGNHFAFVGTSEATGQTCLVTHHGARGPGARLYKLGMRAAQKLRVRLSEGMLKDNAWIPADGQAGQSYWKALQLIRKWTKANHNALHQRAAVLAGAQVADRFWNEHNFVFRKGDLYDHAKGTTPIDPDMMPDTNGVQIVPMNIAEPILLIQEQVTTRNLGFAPHGAGRNYSRSTHKRAVAGENEDAIFARETEGPDIRFYSGNIDISELPSAYKPASTVQRQMAKYGFADVVDRTLPFGSIMAGIGIGSGTRRGVKRPWPNTKRGERDDRPRFHTRSPVQNALVRAPLGRAVMTRGILTTQRLVLSACVPSDAPHIVSSLNRAGVARGLTMVPFPYTMDDAEAFIAQSTGDSVETKAVCRTDGTFVGAMSLGKQLGYWICPDQWGHGYATEAVSGVLGRHFAASDHPVASGYVDDNHASAAVLRKLGFEIIGRQTLYIRSRGQDVSGVSVSLTKDRWEAHQ